MQWQKLVSEWDTKIRSGLGAEVAATLRALPRKDIPVQYLPDVAKLCRRLGLFILGLELLKAPYFQAKEKNLSQYRDQAEVRLLAEYAALLTEIGAPKIAENLFNKLDSRVYPEINFYLALLSIKKWDHESSERYLLAYESQIEDRYWISVSKLNRIANLIFLKRLDEAKSLCSDLEKSNELSPLSRGVLNECKGQCLFYEGKIAEAQSYFRESADGLQNAHNLTQLFAKKWVIICKMLSRGHSSIGPELTNFRDEVRQAGLWEVLRELDRFEALQTHNERLLCKLYFGTPTIGYRRMIERDFAWTAPKVFSFDQSKGSDAIATEFLLRQLQVVHQGHVIEVQGTTALLLKALVSDLYRPLGTGSLFQEIYSKEYFDPESSIGKVHQSLLRSRQKFESLGLPIFVSSDAQGFKLSDESILRVIYDFEALFNERSDVDPETVFLEAKLRTLFDAFGSNGFFTSEAQKVLNISLRSTQRLLSDLTKRSLLTRTGSSRSSLYQIPQNSLHKAS